jgi:hypothetical protein
MDAALTIMPVEKGIVRCRHIQASRPMMPVTAIFGGDLDPAVLEMPESYYAHEVLYFETEREALDWLKNQ